MLRVCDSELEKRMWGAKLPNGKGKIRRYLITDFRAFGLITGIARYLVKSEEKEERIFYRGQAEEWVLKPKLYRDCNTKIEIELANKWKEKALEIALQEGFDYRGKEENVADYREALAQHYGLATSFKVEKRLKEEGLGLEPTQWIQKKISEKGQSVGKWTEI